MIAACCFGGITPVLGWVQGELPPLTVSALLATGMAAAGVVSSLFGGNGPPIPRSAAGRVSASALSGAVLAPALLAFGLSRANGFASCLLLNLEPALCAALGVALYAERVGWRFVVGTAAIVAAATALMSDASNGQDGLVGLVAVGIATALWAVDNAISRPLAGFDSSQVMRAKGGVATFLLLPAIALVEGAPPWDPPAVVGVFACGFVGYGGMERAYLMAQRSLGVARTSSIFAVAPFFGAAVALAGGVPAPSGWIGIGAVMAFGVYLHAVDGYRELSAESA